jgi:hypothetical protein
MSDGEIFVYSYEIIEGHGGNLRRVGGESNLIKDPAIA